MWFIVFLGLVLGVVLGLQMPYLVPVFFAKYLSVAILASIDSLFGGMRATLEKNFDSVILLTGFVSNSLLAAGLAYIGDKLGVSLYIAAVLVFGVRIFENLAAIRRIALTLLRQGKSEVLIESSDSL